MALRRFLFVPAVLISLSAAAARPLNPEDDAPALFRTIMWPITNYSIKDPSTRRAMNEGINVAELLTVFAAPVVVLKGGLLKVVNRETVVKVIDDRVLTPDEIQSIVARPLGEKQRYFIVGLSQKSKESIERRIYFSSVLQRIKGTKVGENAPSAISFGTRMVERHQLSVNPVTSSSAREAMDQVARAGGEPVSQVMAKVQVKNISRAELGDYLTALSTNGVKVQSVTRATLGLSTPRIILGSCVLVYLTFDLGIDFFYGIDRAQQDIE